MRQNISTGMCLGTCILALTATASAQVTQLFTVDGEGAGDDLGFVVAPAGDVDGDGRGDFIVGAPEINQSFGRGYAQVVSGQTGLVIRQFAGTQFLASYGHAVAGVGDLDGDGFDDVAVGAPNDYASGGSSNRRGSVRVFSGADGQELFEWWADELADFFGHSVASAGDVNGDGVPDVVVGATLADPNGISSGLARVFSGADGAVLYTFNGEGASDGFGATVASAGDVDGDGHDDLLVGSSGDYAKVYSGATGVQIYRLNGADGDSFASTVASAGDVDLDGYDDFLIGAKQDGTVAGAAGSAILYSGATGEVIFRWFGSGTLDLHGRSLACAGYVDGDSYLDIIVGGVGYAVVYSGYDGQTMFEVTSSSPFNGFGVSVASAGDVDGDGLDEFVVGVPTDDANGNRSGAAYLFDPVITDGGTTVYCTASANSTGQSANINTAGSLRLSSNDLRLEVHGATTNTTGLFFYGSERTNLPFGGGTMCVGGAVFRLNPGVNLSDLGFASRRIDFNRAPLNSGPGEIRSGDTWRFQFWYRDLQSTGTQFNFSNALEITFQP